MTTLHLLPIHRRSTPRRDCLPNSAPRAAGLRIAAAALVLAAMAPRDAAAVTRQWETAPYRVHAVVCVETSRRPQPRLPAAIAEHIRERVDSALAPVWLFQLVATADAAAKQRCKAMAEIPWDDFSAEQRSLDKLMWLHVEAAPAGYVLRCREFDVYLRQWGPIHERTVAQSAFLAEACFQTLKDAFLPLAVVHTLPEDDSHVQLVFKGSALRRSDVDPLVSPGQAYQPLLRRTDRSGSLVENGIYPVPWTLLTTAERDKRAWTADIHTGIRRPFAGRRGGLVEQLAIGVRPTPGPARVRFHARSDPDQALAGYEVFRAVADNESELIGVTDRNGVIAVPPGDGPVDMLWLRSDGQLLAKLPIPAGAAETIQTPIADDASRLRAQAEARVVREELIDVVARRAILMARVRAMLKAGRVENAQQAMAELDALPSPSAFSRNLDAVANRLPPSDDPQVEKTVEQLFSSTRDLLAKFLSTRPITELQSEVNAAARNGS